MNENIQSIYDFWFGDILTNPDAGDRGKLWFMGGEDVDTAIRDQFEPLLLQAQSGQCDDWRETPQGSLALIILLDQFPLNIYRSDARAYATEQHSVEVALQGIRTKQDRELSFWERAFFYLPLEHSEADKHQVLSVQYFTELLESAPAELKEQATSVWQYAIDHKAIIDQFGRYPHRNKVLGRESTDVEMAYLKDGGATYGQ